MFDIGWFELLVIAIVAIIVVGPRDLPRLMRSVGKFAGKVRRMAGEFRYQFDEAMREAELEEARKEFQRATSPASGFDLRRQLGEEAVLPLREPAKPPAGPAQSDAKPRKKPAGKSKAKSGKRKP